MVVEEKLEKLRLKLPPAPPPAANYRPYVRIGDLIYISGQLPMSGGKVVYTGKVGQDLGEEQAYQAATLCTLNALAQVKAALGSFDNLETVVRVEGFVNSAPGFTQQPRVINGCSDLLKKVLGERGGHARTAVGCNELPLDAAVEIALIVAARRAG